MHTIRADAQSNVVNVRPGGGVTSSVLHADSALGNFRCGRVLMCATSRWRNVSMAAVTFPSMVGIALVNAIW